MNDPSTAKGDHGLSPDEQRAVLDAALTLISEGGLRATFFDKLVGKCGILAARIYTHFGGAEKVIQRVLERELELVAGSVPVPELRFPGETLRDELEGMARILVDQSRTHIGFLGKIMGEAMRNPELAPVFYRTFILRGRKMLTEFLQTRQQRGELRPDADIEAAAAFYLSGLIFSVVLMELFGGKAVESLDDERLVKGMTDVFLKGTAV